MPDNIACCEYFYTPLQYQFLNSKFRRHELVVVELFERDTNMSRYA